MAIYNTIGYLITFDGTTLINHGALCAASVAENNATVALRMYTLPNGNRVNYDGTSDSAITAGEINQEILATTGGIALYGTLAAKLGNRGSLTLSPLSGADVSCNAVLLSIEDTSTRPVERLGEVKMRVTFAVEGDWT